MRHFCAVMRQKAEPDFYEQELFTVQKFPVQNFPGG